MAYTKQQKQTKKASKRSGAILVKFANAKSTVKAIIRLHRRFYKAFNVSLFNAKMTSKRSKKIVRKDQRCLKKFFDELQADKTLEKSDTIVKYNIDYYIESFEQFIPDARYQDKIDLLKELEAKGGTSFETVLAILVFQYLKDENHKEIKKCQYSQCGRYFLARNVRKLFCSDNHRAAQNRLNNKISKNNFPPQEIDAQQPPVMPQTSEPTGMTDSVCPS